MAQPRRDQPCQQKAALLLAPHQPQDLSRHSGGVHGGGNASQSLGHVGRQVLLGLLSPLQCSEIHQQRRLQGVEQGGLAFLARPDRSAADQQPGYASQGPQQLLHDLSQLSAGLLQAVDQQQRRAAFLGQPLHGAEQLQPVAWFIGCHRQQSAAHQLRLQPPYQIGQICPPSRRRRRHAALPRIGMGQRSPLQDSLAILGIGESSDPAQQCRFAAARGAAHQGHAHLAATDPRHQLPQGFHPPGEKIALFVGVDPPGREQQLLHHHVPGERVVAGIGEHHAGIATHQRHQGLVE